MNEWMNLLIEWVKNEISWVSKDYLCFRNVNDNDKILLRIFSIDFN